MLVCISKEQAFHKIINIECIMYINICNYMNVIMVQYKFRVCLKYLSNLPLISSHHPADTFMVRKSIVCISSLIYLISFVAFEVMLFNKSVS